jgi:hypothetical protein
MILVLVVVSQAAQPTLVLIQPFLLLPAFTATLKQDCSTTLTMEPALVFQDTILTQPRPSNAMHAHPSTVQFATQPIPLNATPVPLEPSSTTLPTPAHAQMDTLSTEPLASNVPTAAKPAILPTEPAQLVLTLNTETSPKTASASLDFMTVDQ